ncbi:uncharacterized protein LOC114263173 [Camellia sinensis]|uniref:uncharacterized protein LOC114263173 n=1 Tax=Camellia sinensis TaxID=4442 RepID=UPI001035C329|nr:uncharacterized protein LOC114263173 [Camellia sinensis]
MTWDQFKEIFYEKYFPQCFRNKKKVPEFEQLKQGNMSVAEYEAKFTELARFAPRMLDADYKKAQKFEGGLNLDVFDQLGVLKLPKYMDILDRALMNEANLAAMKQTKAPTTEWGSKRSGYNFRKGHSFATNKKQNTRSTSSSSQSSGSTPVCSECGRKHKCVYYCASGACFLCGKVYHMMKDCSLNETANRPVASLAGSTPTPRTKARVNTGKGSVRQGQVFALVPGDVQDTESVVLGSTNVENIPVVNKFPDLFLNELHGDLIDREIEFTIEVVPRTQPISKTPYRMSTSELKELKI